MVCFFLPKLLLCLVERLDELELWWPEHGVGHNIHVSFISDIDGVGGVDSIQLVIRAFLRGIGTIKNDMLEKGREVTDLIET